MENQINISEQNRTGTNIETLMELLASKKGVNRQKSQEIVSGFRKAGSLVADAGITELQIRSR